MSMYDARLYEYRGSVYVNIILDQVLSPCGPRLKIVDFDENSITYTLQPKDGRKRRTSLTVSHHQVVLRDKDGTVLDKWNSAEEFVDTLFRPKYYGDDDRRLCGMCGKRLGEFTLLIGLCSNICLENDRAITKEWCDCVCDNDMDYDE